MDNTSVCFSDLLAVFQRLTGINRFWIAYSGGLDSSVLLHIMYANRHHFDSDIAAVHVDHQISKNSVLWSRHCKITCEKLDIPLKEISVDASSPQGTGLEAHARQLRYDAMMNLMNRNDVLLTAHHQDDLAETFILQLMRGAGPEGLAGIPAIRSFGKGWLVRPMLAYSRKQLEEYAGANNLEWVDDESNLNLDINRNYIRNQVMSCLEQRWPAAARTIARSASHQSDVIDILKEVANADFESTKGNSKDILDLVKLKKLSEPRQKNLLRYWIRLNNHPLPGNNIVKHVLSEVVYARYDRTPLVNWQTSEIRRYRNRLYILKSSSRYFNNAGNYTWHMETPLEFEWGTLYAREAKGKGIRSSSITDNTVDVRFRRGGEKIYPANRHETHKLKKLFQEKGIPPWRRKKIPLLYINNQLAAVPGYWIDKNFNAGDNEAGWEVFFD